MGGTVETGLWAVVIGGLDEAHPMPSHSEAVAIAEAHNALMADEQFAHPELWEQCQARVVPWTGGGKSHALGVLAWRLRPAGLRHDMPGGARGGRAGGGLVWQLMVYRELRRCRPRWPRRIVWLLAKSMRQSDLYEGVKPSTAVSSELVFWHG